MRICDECGFDWDCDPPAIADEIGTAPRRFEACLTRLLDGEDRDRLVRARPASGVWSALEYTVHMRDVFEFYVDRMDRVLVEDRPQLTARGFHELAEERRYNDEDIDVVLSSLGSWSATARSTIDELSDEQWQRAGVGSDGDERTVLTLARRLAHECHHHLLDVGRVLRSVREEHRQDASER